MNRKTRQVRAIIDTNVMVDGIMSSSQDRETLACKEIRNAITDGKVQMVLNRDTLHEYLVVMTLRIYNAANSNRSWFRNQMLSILEPIYDAEYTSQVTTNWEPDWISDPSDAMFVICAIDAGVPYIVSSDRSLRDLRYFIREQPEVLHYLDSHRIFILSPSQFARKVLQPLQTQTTS